jgi:hypothetical protein
MGKKLFYYKYECNHIRFNEIAEIYSTAVKGIDLTLQIDIQNFANYFS